MRATKDLRALTDLRRFIHTKNNDFERDEIRLYLEENAVDLALAFGVSVAAFGEAIDKIEDDVELCIRMLDGIRRATKSNRAQKRDARTRTAQEFAGILGAAALWRNDGALLDVPSMLAYTLTRRDDLLVFVADGWTVAVRMAPLFDLRRLARRDLAGWVDAKGLHVRWSTGGLNFVPVTDPHAEKIVVALPDAERMAA